MQLLRVTGSGTAMHQTGTRGRFVQHGSDADTGAGAVVFRHCPRVACRLRSGSDTVVTPQ